MNPTEFIRSYIMGLFVGAIMVAIVFALIYFGIL
jgi:hypothetical protein